MSQFEISGITVEVSFKDIKNVHLSVHPPQGRVSISAPLRMNVENIRLYALSRLPWIRKHQKQMNAQVRDTEREYLNRESHYYLGKRYLLNIVEQAAKPSVSLHHNHLIINVRNKHNKQNIAEVLYQWYRNELRQLSAEYFIYWQKRLGVSVNKIIIQKMRTKWGGCNYREGNVRLNTELIKKPKSCIEYVIVHELLHLIYPKHNQDFIAHLTLVMPDWAHRKKLLGEYPLAYESW